MATVIRRDQFLNAFAAEWEKRLKEDRIKLMLSYDKEAQWTPYMLSSETGFLCDVMERLKPLVGRLQYKKEIYTVDAMYVGGEDLYRNNLCYPSVLYVLIEHEHSENIEEEMWKLIFWRSPLKVLIFYDWNEDIKINQRRKIWLTNKLEALSKMNSAANSIHQEDFSTEYLFVIGSRNPVNREVMWRWASNHQMQPTVFAGG